jgi:DNA-binding LytR/AlgR family response regulator
MQWKTLIVEDEEMAAKSMQRMVNKHPDLVLSGTCNSGEEATRFLEENNVDLILLDVEMPGLSGFDFLDAIEVNPFVILTTSKEKYAYDGFRYKVFDFLKKPVSTPTFQTAIINLVHQHQPPTSGAKETAESRDIYFKVDQKLVKVRFDEIKYIENTGNYAVVHTTRDKLVVYVTIKTLLEKLPAKPFVKVHRSYIVNTDFIQDIEQNSILIDGKMIPVSRAMKPELLSRLNTL